MANIQSITNEIGQSISLNDIVVYSMNNTTIAYGIVDRISDKRNLSIYPINIKDSIIHFVDEHYRIKNVDCAYNITSNYIDTHTFGKLYSIKKQTPLYFNNSEQIRWYLYIELWNMFMRKTLIEFNLSDYHTIYFSYNKVFTNKSFDNIIKGIDASTHINSQHKQASNYDAVQSKKYNEFIDALNFYGKPLLAELLNAEVLYVDYSMTESIYYLTNFDFSKYKIPTSTKYKKYLGPVIIV